MATESEPAFIETASRHLQAALRNERALTRWITRENFERERIAFRAIDAAIGEAGGYICDVGLFSRERIENPDPWQRELVVHHLTDGKGGQNRYPEHDRHPSPYMSISTSPQKMANFTRERINQKEIVIIDMDMLDIMKVNYRSTTELANEFKFRDEEDGPTYTTSSHYLVYEHIPQCCILGFMSAVAFKALWTDKSRNINNDRNHHGPQVLNWYEDLKEHKDLSHQSAFQQTPQFDAVVHESTPPPVTPQSSGRMKRTINLLDDASLSTGRSRTKRSRSPSLERTISAEENSRRDKTRRILWADSRGRTS